MILNSFEGQTILGFNPPKSPPKYNIDATDNLKESAIERPYTDATDNLIVWDLEAKDYRTITAARTVVNNLVPEEKFYEQLVEQSVGSIASS